MEAISKYYLEDGHLEPIKNYTNDSLDRGRIIYEVIRVINNVPLFYEDHLKRLESSFRLMEKTFSYSYDKIKEYLRQSAQPVPQHYLYLKSVLPALC